MRAGGLFAEWQPQYAERGIATFPVCDKRPAVGNHLKMGLPASRQLVARFSDAEGLGFACGKRSAVTVVDVDSPDERLLADALDDFGPTPLIVRSGSGNFQAWYRHHGERRRIRPDKSRPIDILGGGYVVAPPSRTPRGAYALIQGCLDDLASLPAIRQPQSPVAAHSAPHDGKRVERGQRNETLWRACMKQARDCPDVESLMGFAMKANDSMFYEPLADEEVLRVVASAWCKEQGGENGFGRGRRVVIPHDHIDGLLHSNPDAFILLTILRANHWGREFICANAMAESMPGGGWRRQRFAAARHVLEQAGEIVLVRPASRQTGPAVYRLKGVQNCTAIYNLHPSPLLPPQIPAGDFPHSKRENG